MYVTFLVSRFHEFISLIIQYKYLNIMRRIRSPKIWFSAPDDAELILFTMVEVFHLRLTQTVIQKWFVQVRNQFRELREPGLPKDRWLSLALQYFKLIHRVGRITRKWTFLFSSGLNFRSVSGARLHPPQMRNYTNREPSGTVKADSTGEVSRSLECLVCKSC